jgi:hypothetical protein
MSHKRSPKPVLQRKLENYLKSTNAPLRLPTAIRGAFRCMNLFEYPSGRRLLRALSRSEGLAAIACGCRSGLQSAAGGQKLLFDGCLV